MTVQLRYSGGDSNRFARASIGGAISSTAITTDDMQNLFDDVTRVEIINGKIDYRCFFIYNDGTDDYIRLQLKNIMIPKDTEISFAVDDSEIPQLLQAEDLPPIGLTFFDLDRWLNFELPLGLLNVGSHVAIWIKRRVFIGSLESRVISILIAASDNNLVISQDFNSIENGFDNLNIVNISPMAYVDVNLIGEALVS